MTLAAPWRRALGRVRRALLGAPPLPGVEVEGNVELSGCGFLGHVRIGYRSYANDTLFRNATVGRFCSIGRRCSIGAALHDLAALTTHPFGAPDGFEPGPTTEIGNDVWIGDNVVVVAGTRIGDGAVIGAGAVVTRDVPPFLVVGGVPARRLRARFPNDLAAALAASRWWRWGDAAVLAGRGRAADAAVAGWSPGDAPELLPHHRPYRPE